MHNEHPPKNFIIDIAYEDEIDVALDDEDALEITLEVAVVIVENNKNHRT